MKSAKTMTILMALLFLSVGAIKGTPDVNTKDEEIQVVCSPELEGLATRLVSDYLIHNQDIQIKITAMPVSEIHGAMKEGTVALLGDNNLKDEKAKAYFKLVFGRDAIVPLINSGNPNRDLILEQGISPDEFSRIYTGKGSVTWGEILDNADHGKIHVLLPGGASAKNYLCEFLGVDLSGIQVQVVPDPEEMIKKIQADPQAIGFCSLAGLIQQGKNEELNSVELVPVDMDADNRIGSFEEIYGSASSLSHAIYVGRFPHALYSRIYFVTNKQPVGAGSISFMEWMLDEGQKSLAMAGMLELGYGERNSRIEKLRGQEQAIANVPVKASPARIYLIVAGFLFILGVLVYALARIIGKTSQSPVAVLTPTNGQENFPGGIFFDSTHTWAFMEKNGRVRIGIDGFLQQLAGPLTRVAMKKPGEQIKKGENFLTLIQNGKRLEIKSPLTGIVREQNEELVEDVSSLNADPYSSGWILLVEPQNWLSELKGYFMGKSYSQWLKQEGNRLKAFFTSVMKLEDASDPELVLQDGGEIRAGMLESFGPEVWEEFQEKFINRER